MTGHNVMILKMNIPGNTVVTTSLNIRTSGKLQFLIPVLMAPLCSGQTLTSYTNFGEPGDTFTTPAPAGSSMAARIRPSHTSEPPLPLQPPRLVSHRSLAGGP